MRNNLVVNTSLNLSDYFNVVDDIALSYFDVDGKYQPHMGFINSIKVFYNYCVEHSNLDGVVEHDFTDLREIESIIQDKGIMGEYYKAIEEPSFNCIDFSRAYHDALDIVEYKKSSMGGIADQINGLVDKLLTQFAQVFNREDLDKISEITKHFAEYGVDADAVIKAYGKSEKFNNDLIDLDEHRNKKTQDKEE